VHIWYKKVDGRLVAVVGVNRARGLVEINVFDFLDHGLLSEPQFFNIHLLTATSQQYRRQFEKTAKYGNRSDFKNFFEITFQDSMVSKLQKYRLRFKLFSRYHVLKSVNFD
jgi:hypothetical protein